MKKLLSGLLATTLAASFAIASVVPVNATPVFVPKADTAQTDVQNVQYQPWRRMNRMDRRIDRRIDRRVDRRVDRRSGYNGNGYYNGYRGYRDYHHGYRRHGDYWYPAAAFLAGALITGAIVNNNPRRLQRQFACVVVLRPLPVLPGVRQHLQSREKQTAPAVLFAL